MRADLALVGFGNVGRRFAQLLEQRRDWLALDYDLECRVVGICHAASRQRSTKPAIDAVAGGHVARGWDRPRPRATALRAAADGSLDVIDALGGSPRRLKVLVETTTLDIAAGQPAIDHVRAALHAGCHVVTANKGPARVRLRGARRARQGPRSLVPVRRRGDGRRPDLQPRARDAAGGADPRLSRRHQQHDQSHPERARGRRGVRRRARSACRQAASPKRIRRSTSTAGTRRRRPRRSRTC